MLNTSIEAHKQKKKLTTTQKQLNLPVLKLKQDVPTRWNSTYDMFQRIMQVKDAVITTIALLRPDLNIKQEDWEVIEEVLPVLKPFYEVTVEISAERNVTLSNVIVFNNLIQDLKKKYVSHNKKIIAVQSVMKKGMEIRFKDLENNILYAECTILDPRLKARALKNQDYREHIIEELKNKVSEIPLQFLMKLSVKKGTRFHSAGYRAQVLSIAGRMLCHLMIRKVAL